MATTKRRNLARPRNAISSMQRPLNRTFKVCCANGSSNGGHRREQLYREWISDTSPQSLTLRYTSLRVQRQQQQQQQEFAEEMELEVYNLRVWQYYVQRHQDYQQL
jgi:hypothetical protein